MLTAILAIFLFVCAFLGFKEGLRLGIQVNKGVEPPKIRNPITVVQQAVQQTKQEYEQTKADKRYTEDLEKMMSYTGDIEDDE